MQIEGALGYIILMGVSVAIGMKIVQQITDKAMEHKGMIGLVVICYFTTLFLLLNDRAVADFLNVGRFDVDFIALCFSIIPTVLLLVMWREKEKQAFSAVKAASSKAKRTASKTKAKIRGK